MKRRKKLNDEKYLIQLCEEAGLVLIKEHFKQQYRYIVRSDDETVVESDWSTSGSIWSDMTDESTVRDVEKWMKTYHIEVTTEVLVL
jgi:hypothetical protein